MDSNHVQIPRPEQWETFENLCLEIFRTVWNDQTAKKHGRRGQSQCGTDVYGHQDGKAGPILGVQCKGKDGNLGKAVTKAELLKEIEKAKKFKPPLSSWILATTAPNNERLEEVARQITQEHQEKGLFKVQVFGWNDLESFIRKDEGVQRQFYPELLPQLRNAAIELAEYLRTQNPDEKKSFEIVRTASREDLEKHFAFSGVRSTVQLGLRRGDEAFGRRPLIGDLAEGKVFVVEAGPGAGKTTALLQLADQLHAETTSFIPIVLPLQDLSGADFLDYVHERPSFQQFGKASLVKLANLGQIVLLCDGWNELSPTQRSPVQTTIRKFRRDYPKCGLLFATRAMTPAPLDKVDMLRLAVPSRAQQVAILHNQVGDRAEDVLREARAIPGLAEVLRTPLYLVVLASIGSDGAIPETKDEAIRRFLENQTRRHADKLREVFYQNQDSYLEAIAIQLTYANTTVIGDAELRTVVTSVTKALAAAGQIGEREPQKIIDALVAYHTLIERPGTHDGRTPYSFQHQQFQEWYASHYAEACIAAAHRAPTAEAKAALDEILNSIVWEEALTFAVERLSRKSSEGLAQCASTILRSLAIDPMLGAVLIRRSALAIWDQIKERVVRFGEVWLEGQYKNRVVRFMIGTGKSEFADAVWHIYGAEERARSLRSFPFGWFGAESLGSEWSQKYLALDTTLRRSLLFDLMHNGTQSGIDFAQSAAAIDPEPVHFREVLDMLRRYGMNAEFKELLKKASPAVWQDLAVHYPLPDDDEEFKGRLIEAQKALVSDAEHPHRVYVLLELADAGIQADASTIVASLLDMEAENYQDSARLYARVGALFPEALVDAVRRRIASGEPVLPVAKQYALPALPKGQDELVALLVEGALPDRREWHAISGALDEQSIEKLIREMIELDKRMARAAVYAEKRVFSERWNAISDVLSETSASALIRSLLRIPINDPAEIGLGSRLIYRWSGLDRSKLSQAIDADLLAELRARLKEWVAAIIPCANTNRSRLADLATSIKAVADIELLDPLTNLLDAELAAWTVDRERLAALRAEKRGGQADYSYTIQYCAAFDAIQGDAVGKALLRYLGQPLFEQEAATQLIRFGVQGQKAQIQTQMGFPLYESVPAIRAARAKIGRPHAVAERVLNRIDELIASAKPDELQRAIRMATAAVEMEIGPRIATIHTVMATAPIIDQADFIHVVMMMGEDVDPDLLTRGIEAAFARAEARKWSWGREQEWWPIESWLKLLAISRDPNRILPYLPRIPREMAHWHDYDKILIILGHGDPTTALPVLQALSKMDGVSHRHAFVDALMRLGSAEALNYLIDLILGDTGEDRFEYNSSELSTQLSDFCRENAAARLKLLQKTQEKMGGAAKSLLHHLVPRLLNAEDIIPIIKRSDPKGEAPMTKLAWDAIRNLAVIYTEVENANWMETEAQDLTALRAELFELSESDHPNAELALRFLNSIEHYRDHDGKPASEPRHPAIASGKPWPRAAGVLVEANLRE